MIMPKLKISYIRRYAKRSEVSSSQAILVLQRKRRIFAIKKYIKQLDEEEIKDYNQLLKDILYMMRELNALI